MTQIPSSLLILPRKPVPRLETIQPRTAEELERSLRDYSLEERRQVRALWQTHAARHTLIDFRAQDTRATRSKEYGFQPETLTYFAQVGDRTRAVRTSSIKLDVSRFAHGVQQELRELTNQMLAEQLPAQRWYDESARLLKLSYRATVDVARGSGEDMEREERERWLELALLLLLLLNRAAQDINAGVFPLDGRLTAYIGSLGAANNGLFENWRLAEAKRLGYTEGRRFLRVADHCHDSGDRRGCVELADLGWVPIEQVVPLGGATCRLHCRCELHFQGRHARTFVTLINPLPITV